jgi:hypothetical protein
MLPSYTNLTRLKQYLKRFFREDQPAAFEYLVSGAFSQIFDLTFQSKDNEDSSVKHRVIWYGKVNKKNKIIVKSPSGPDSICFACGFYVLFESTLRNGTDQWRKEFIESIKHYDDFVRQQRVNKGDVYLILIVRRLHKDTFNGFQQKAIGGYNIILLETSLIAKIGNITKAVFTVRNTDLRQLFNNLVKALRESTSFRRFRDNIGQYISEWQKEIHKTGKIPFMGVRSYETICKVVHQKGRANLSVGEIYRKLLKDPIVKDYFEVIGDKPLISYVEQGLIDQGLGVVIGTTSQNEPLFEPVHIADFKRRGLRLIKAVENLNV